MTKEIQIRLCCNIFSHGVFALFSVMKYLNISILYTAKILFS